MTHLFPAYTVDTSGKEKEAIPENKIRFTSAELQRHLGYKYIKTLKTTDGKILLCDSEKQPHYRVNVKATLLYVHAEKWKIYGKVMILNPELL